MGKVGEVPWSALTSCLAMASSLTIWRILKKLWPYPELLKRDAMMMPQTLHSEKLKEGSFSGVNHLLIDLKFFKFSSLYVLLILQENKDDIALIQYAVEVMLMQQKNVTKWRLVKKKKRDFQLLF